MSRQTRSCRTCRLLTAAICAVALAASPAGAREPFEIVYQNDGIMGIAPRTMPHFPRWQSVDDVTDPAYYAAEADNYADCGVKSISWGLWSGGNSFNHPTKVGVLWCEGIPDEVMTHPTRKSRTATGTGPTPRYAISTRASCSKCCTTTTSMAWT